MANEKVVAVIAYMVFLHLDFAMSSVHFSNETFGHRKGREIEDSKRYLVFPQGSNVQLIYCLTIGTYTKPATFFTMGVTAGLAWELPHTNTVPYRKPAEVYHRRSRRELYRKVELMLSTRGKDGKACVLKALCQAGKRGTNETAKGTFMQEILHSIFTLPHGHYDQDPMTEYEKSYQVTAEDDCEKKYPSCPNSTVSKKNVGNENSVESNRRLSRKKRHLAFPTGTNFVTTITLLKAIQVNEPKNWNLDLEFDMIWPIPNGEKLLKKASKRTNIYHHIRRHKRDLYSKIELALSSQGLPGKECLLRTICEANIYLSSPGVSFLEDVLRVVLSGSESARREKFSPEVESSPRDRERKMSFFQRSIVVLFVCILPAFLVDGDGRERSLSRKKRYVVFPEGSSFSIALCMTVHTLTPDNIFTEGLNWGISYDLPNESKPELEPFLELRKDKPHKYQYLESKNQLVNPPGWKHDAKWTRAEIHGPKLKKKYHKAGYDYLKRRHRRDLYSKLEIIMNAMNFDGRSCVLRALCEASQRLMPKGRSLVEEMMRIAFTLPLTRVLSYEPEEHRTYANAHTAGYEGRDCAAMFASCSFSLIDMALGKYSVPEQKYKPSYFPRNPVDASQGEHPNVGSLEATSETSAIVRYNMK
ncbi:uncharacterized protein [Venturia canescens]|uniref:uncharacterized protein n=1 Tax=Venturia canescens TaxID=32260 RepID=UPI001C9C8D4A|nr:uncharacterized protein LOC122418387 [Venturia canescens]